MKKTRILAVILAVALIAVSAMFISCKDGNVLGKGKTSVKVEVTDDKGATKTYTIKTDEKILGNALTHADVKLVALDEYGMVDTVNGLKAVWDDNIKSWWSFAVDGEFVSFGVMEAEIDPSAVYSFTYTDGSDIDWGDFGDYDYDDFDDSDDDEPKG